MLYQQTGERSERVYVNLLQNLLHAQKSENRVYDKGVKSYN